MEYEDAGGFEGFTSNLDLHSTLPTQVGCLNYRDEIKNPVNSIDRTNDIQFVIKSALNELIDPNHIYLMLETRITDGAGAVIDQLDGANAYRNESEVFTVDGINHSWFKNCVVKLNNVQIASGDGLYAYRGDFETKLMKPKTVKDGCLKLSGFYNDNIKFEDLVHGNALHNACQAENPTDGFYQRHQMTKNGNSIHTIGRIHSEIFDQPKLLPPNSKLEIYLDKQDNPAFLLLKKVANAQQCKIQLVKCQLKVRYITVDPGVVEEIIGTTESGDPYRMPIRRVKMSYFTKANNTTDFSEVNLLKEEILPRRLFIGIVRQNAFHGDFTLNPYNYQHCNAHRITLRVGGQIRPYPELECDIATKNIMQPLSALLSATDSFLGDEELGITPLNYLKENFFIGYDLSSSGLNVGDAFDLPDSKDVELSYHLTAPTGNVMTMIIYAEYDAEIEIDANNNVKVHDFAL